MAAPAVHVENLRTFLRACDVADEKTALFLRVGLHDIAEDVAKDARALYEPYSARGAEGVKPKVTRPGNAIVAQTLRKTRNAMRSRPNFGGLMMRTALLPALRANEENIRAKVQLLFAEIERGWDF